MLIGSRLIRFLLILLYYLRRFLEMYLKMNTKSKQHPLLKQYAVFNDREKDVYRTNIREAIKEC